VFQLSLTPTFLKHTTKWQLTASPEDGPDVVTIKTSSASSYYIGVSSLQFGLFDKHPLSLLASADLSNSRSLYKWKVL